MPVNDEGAAAAGISPPRSGWKLLRFTAGVLIYGASIVLIVRYLDANLSDRIIQLVWSPAAVATLILLVAHRATMARLWGRLLDDDERPKLPQDLVHYIYGLSLLARYVPGKILAAVIRIAQHRTLDRTPAAIATSTLVELAIAIATGGIFGLALVAVGTLPAQLAYWTGGAAAAAALSCWWFGPQLQRALSARFNRHFSTPELVPESLGTRPALLIGAAATTFAVLGYGSFAATVVPSATVAALAQTSGIYLLSGIAGTLAFFAPGGIGVREFAQYEGLSGLADAETILALIIGARILDICTDVIYLTLAIANKYVCVRRRRHATITEDAGC